MEWYYDSVVVEGFSLRREEPYPELADKTLHRLDKSDSAVKDSLGLCRCQAGKNT